MELYFLKQSLHVSEEVHLSKNRQPKTEHRCQNVVIAGQLDKQCSSRKSAHSMVAERKPFGSV